MLPRNAWAFGLTSFSVDLSSEILINVLRLFLSNVLAMKTKVGRCGE